MSVTGSVNLARATSSLLHFDRIQNFFRKPTNQPSDETGGDNQSQKTRRYAIKMTVQGMGTMMYQQVRRFTSGMTIQFPLQPAKQRKTVPIRNPRRPHLPDPVDSDPSAQRFKLAEHPRVMFVIREPGGTANLADKLGKPATLSSKTEAIDPAPPSPTIIGLSHPILSSSSSSLPSSSSSSPAIYKLPPPLRKPKPFATSLTPSQALEIQKLRPSHSLSHLSRKFNIPRILVAILGPPSPQDRTLINSRHSLRTARKQARWSVPKVVRRHEKLVRRSCW
ncbi:uncharacterized protein PGTG_07511 [Puccinia graminis f. sp. tritici CRL 75-36-700-3]|uniref:Uncharacterized protein n=1 Tax=Puccinia graminis f. sp. tritici (strain CRL 75-36-700-3 / race SCCL) TaxID=418459 RepID=E3KD90_PUCGT|nr:uncharacterized protein PGTG_07511 [Puccinia graminis f. sp. tritici CRL 75-36-700-3]EFP82114.2 hypothetical protein PGTG_07511 [Puccinia graminis f. sp. tritici CRL 75-36-700-3]